MAGTRQEQSEIRKINRIRKFARRWRNALARIVPMSGIIGTNLSAKNLALI